MKTVIKAKGDISVYYDGSVTVRGKPLSDAVKAALYKSEKEYGVSPYFGELVLTVEVDDGPAYAIEENGETVPYKER